MNKKFVYQFGNNKKVTYNMNTPNLIVFNNLNFVCF